MNITIVIPTFRRSDKLCACIKALCAQTGETGDYEVIVTFDGPDEPAANRIQALWRDEGMAMDRLQIVSGPKGGPCMTRNRAITRARGSVLIFFNDDVMPAVNCVAEHARAHRELASQGERAIIVGDSPWMIHEPDSLFAQMLRETSMVFFHHRMREGPEDSSRDWGYRHAWLLNLSVATEAVTSVGGLAPISQTYGRDDDELAFRLTRHLGMSVRWRPTALVVHDHAMSPRDYLRREYELGFGALAFANGAPVCAQDLFNRDLRDAAVLHEARHYASAHFATANVLAGWLLSLENVPPTTDHTSIHSHYTRHLPLKRWMWHSGLADSAEGKPFSPEAALAHLFGDNPGALAA